MGRALLVYQDESGKTLVAEVIADGLTVTARAGEPIRFDLSTYALDGYTVIDKSVDAIAQQLALEGGK